MYLAIDPGISTGWAFFGEDLKVVACGAGATVPDGHTTGGLTRYPLVMVIERPKIYPARNMKGDPNDIVTLALQVGGYMYQFGTFGHATVKTIYPHEWKQQVPKDIHHPRIWRKLNIQEQAIVDQAGRGLNKKALGDMFDAIGIGQYAAEMGMFKP